MFRVHRLRRTLRRPLVRAGAAGLLLTALITAGAVMFSRAAEPSVPPAAYVPLLNTIAKGESMGNYNAYYGSPANTSVRFTEMPVAEVLRWQEAYVRQGSASSAVGRYQLIRPTLAGLVQQLGLDPQTRFDEALQDHLAIKLLERRGSLAFVDRTLSREQFAANLAKEWAALPKVIGDDPEESYYADDGINRARVSVSEVYQAISGLQPM